MKQGKGLVVPTDVVGWSIFAVDPGEDTGWAWACIGRKELARWGEIEALQRARDDRSGALLGDRRFMLGEIGYHSSFNDVNEREVEQARSIVIQMKACGNVAARTSGGRVTGVSDCVIEDFVLRERTKERNLLSPVRCTAMVRVFMYTMDVGCPTYLYSASDAKSTFTDERLQRWGFWTVGKQHARDATRLLLLHLRKLYEAL